jgi:hypothetical protein
MQEAGAALYQQQGPAPDGGPGAPGGEAGPEEPGTPDEDVIEGEFSDA